MADIQPARSVTWGKASAIVRARKWEEDIAATIREWAVKYPDQLVAQARITKFSRQEGLYRKGWGGDGKMESAYRYADIPRTLFRMMILRFGRHWYDKQDMLEAFFRHFKVGVINLRDRPKFGREGLIGNG